MIGSFPTLNARTTEELGQWLTDIDARLADLEAPAPPCPNLIVGSARALADAACLARHRVELVITSVGSPKPVIPILHDAGALVFADVASLDHARKARDAGADGLVLLTAGAGGQTGWLNPLAFVRAVRAEFDGPIILAGGISDGVALKAAITLGCDLAYMGTKFIATHESMATDAYRTMLRQSSMDDVILTSHFSGLPASFLMPSIRAAGIAPEELGRPADERRAISRRGVPGETPKRWKDIWSAGHSVSGVDAVLSVEELVARTIAEFETA
ncbi:MAG: nitronate monooxygenase [Sphingopyxis sp.]|nr:nitronate monooxygenase [Sphingopyxis sp.]